jgi:hypothetical protein
MVRDLSEIEQLADIFGAVTGNSLDEPQRQAEVARAIHDDEALVKEQIKMEVLKAVRQIFQVNYQRITGDEAWS